MRRLSVKLKHSAPCNKVFTYAAFAARPWTSNLSMRKRIFNVPISLVPRPAMT